jgi:hypothetical protein
LAGNSFETLVGDARQPNETGRKSSVNQERAATQTISIVPGRKGDPKRKEALSARRDQNRGTRIDDE